jgi:DNA-binding NarL/FixJ family response regulator
VSGLGGKKLRPEPARLDPGSSELRRELGGRVPDETRIAIIEDQKPLRDGLAALIGGTPGYRVVGGYGSMEQALPQLRTVSPEVLLLDIGLPGMNGIEGVREARRLLPELQVLMLTVFSDNDRIFEAICAGACGYLLKDTPPARLLEAIGEAHGGGAPMSPEVARKVVAMFRKTPPPREEALQLSPREQDVLRLLAEGHSYKTAAAAISLSTDTIRFHIRHIYEKLHVHSKSEAVIKALRSGLIR